MIHPHGNPSATAATRPNPTRHGTGGVGYALWWWKLRDPPCWSPERLGLSAFECEASCLTVSVEPADMVLYGPVQDQAALWGLVDRILSSGLEVVEVRRLP